MFSSACHDQIKVVDELLVVCGFDNRLRVFNMITEKLLLKYKPHNEVSYINCSQIKLDIAFSYSNNEIVKSKYL